jgi:translation initiation factor 2 subunit 2
MEQFEEPVIDLSKKKKKKVNIDEQSLMTEEPHEHTYMELLDRVYSQMQTAGQQIDTKKKSHLPTPQLAMVGSKRTAFLNFSKLTKVLNRNQEHLQKYIGEELSAETSIDGSQRLIIKGRYKPVQIQGILGKYINTYVKCAICNSLDTILVKNAVTRLTSINCEICKSNRTVPNINCKKNMRGSASCMF